MRICGYAQLFGLVARLFRLFAQLSGLVARLFGLVAQLSGLVAQLSGGTDTVLLCYATMGQGQTGLFGCLCANQMSGRQDHVEGGYNRLKSNKNIQRQMVIYGFLDKTQQNVMGFVQNL